MANAELNKMKKTNQNWLAIVVVARIACARRHQIYTENDDYFQRQMNTHFSFSSIIYFFQSARLFIKLRLTLTVIRIGFVAA